jgi:two-component system C4-dicarboxylate transport sensor histidine kinase DctB
MMKLTLAADARAWPRMLLVLAVGLGLVASWLAGVVAARQTDTALAREAAVSASLYEAVLRNALERYRALPLVLASDGAIASVLLQADVAALRELDARLAALAAQTSAAAIYVIDAEGRTVSASNADTPLSFVGREFTFRAYFAEAMARGRGEQFALGTTTNQPGLYLSARVEADGRAVGVVVTKIDFSAVEAEWRRAAAPVFVTDKDGTVIITSIEPWRFKPEAKLGLAVSAKHPAHLTARLPGAAEAEFVRAGVGTTTAGWTLNLLQPAGPLVDAAVTAASTLTLLAAAALIVIGWLLLRRRLRAAQLAESRALAQAELEARVTARTHELREANELLTAEIEERRRAEAALLLLHLELEQANRLTTLGQIAAGVTHEINQPVAAIATWAHNARVLLARGDTVETEKALGTIHGLTERIGRITGELRDFARKSDGPPMVVPLEAAIEGARLLVSARKSRDGGTIDSRGVPDGLAVLADRIRLEQVLVNLLQNALEAMTEAVAAKKGNKRGAARIEISARRLPSAVVEIRVSDQGPGISAEMAATLFTPFQTSKARGLGLGLVISRDICRAMAGDLLWEPTAQGACFVITLPAAAAGQAVAA